MIGGNVCIRDGERTDYCWREAVLSLLPLCSTVYICDGGSTDGTLEAIQEWQRREPRITLVHFPWDNPVGEAHLWVRWLNYCRSHIREPWHLQLDADEILYPESHDWIRAFTQSTPHPAAAWGHRHNFWRDPWHLLPLSEVCGHHVARLASTSLWMPTDYPHPLGEELCRLAVESPIRIGHYGWLRRRAGMVQKQRDYQGWTLGSLDPRLAAAESSSNWCEAIAAASGWRERVARYDGSHPALIHPWLEARGHDPIHPHYD